jgi:hypothetical protein
MHRFPPHDPNFPDVDPATGDERETTVGLAKPVNQALVAHDSDPDTDSNTHNHRFDGDGNLEPAGDLEFEGHHVEI